MKYERSDRHTHIYTYIYAKLNARHMHAQFMSRYHVVRLVSHSTHREKSLIFILTERVETMTQFALFLYEEVRKRSHF